MCQKVSNASQLFFCCCFILNVFLNVKICRDHRQINILFTLLFPCPSIDEYFYRKAQNEGGVFAGLSQTHIIDEQTTKTNTGRKTQL